MDWEESKLGGGELRGEKRIREQSHARNDIGNQCEVQEVTQISQEQEEDPNINTYMKKNCHNRHTNGHRYHVAHNRGTRGAEGISSFIKPFRWHREGIRTWSKLKYL